MKDINIVLVEPEIPQNSGNIARTCAVIGAALHLVKPMGFKIDSAKLKRAGLDYWDKLEIYYYDDLEQFLHINEKESLYFFTKKGNKCYADTEYADRCFLVFGKETKGLDEELLHDNPEKCVRIPMRNSLRSLNLSNTVAIAAYEVLRQDGFEGLEKEGHLNRYNW